MASIAASAARVYKSPERQQSGPQTGQPPGVFASPVSPTLSGNSFQANPNPLFLHLTWVSSGWTSN